MSPFLAIADSGTDSIRGQFVEHLLMLSTWAACGRAGEPFPDHHLSLDPAPAGNLCSTQDPEIDARSLEDACNPFFFSRPISDCTQSLYPIAHLWSRPISLLQLILQATNLQATQLPAQAAQLLTTASPAAWSEENTSPFTTSTTTTETFESTSSEFEPTEAFPRLNCGGRGFYQVG